MLAVALFDAGYHVQKAVIIPHSIVLSLARRVEHTNSWRFDLRDSVYQAEGVRDVTTQIQRAAEDIEGQPRP